MKVFGASAGEMKIDFPGFCPPELVADANPGVCSSDLMFQR